MHALSQYSTFKECLKQNSSLQIVRVKVREKMLQESVLTLKVPSDCNAIHTVPTITPPGIWRLLYTGEIYDGELYCNP